MAKNRLYFERRKITQEIQANPEILQAGPLDDSNIYIWQVLLRGPSETPYEGGTFLLRVEFPTEYPFKPPKIKFNTKIFHPNISRKGTICMDILAEEWSPALTLVKILISISSLLASPNPDDPMDTESATMYQENYDCYQKTARNWTDMYAK